MNALRLGGGFVVGTVLGAVLSWYVHPLGFMSDEIIRERAALLALLLAHATAVPAGALVALVALVVRRHAVFVAFVSVWFGVALGSSHLYLDPLSFFPGLYPFLAAFGAALVDITIRRGSRSTER